MSKIKDLLLVSGRHTSRKFFKLGNDVFIQADGENNKLSDHKNKKYGNDVMSFRKVNLNEYESRINNIIEKLKGSVDVEELIRQSLYDTSLKDIETIEKELAKKEPKVKPEKDCVALKIGKNQLVLRQ